MAKVTLQPMTPSEFADWRTYSIQGYAQAHVTAGTYPQDEAVERSTGEFDVLLPEGLDSPQMLLFTARDENAVKVGMVWVSLIHPRGAPDSAFVYDIEVDAEHRGKGYGRALLAAAEDEVRQRGIGAMALNVFGDNPVAIELYTTSGYRVTTQQMRKGL